MSDIQAKHSKLLKLRELKALRAQTQAQQGGEDSMGRQPDGFNTIDMVKNVPNNALDIGRGMIDTIKDPVKTAETMGGLIGGGVQAAVGSQKMTPQREQFNNVIQEYAKNYGSTENFLSHLQEKPLDVLMDVSSILFGAGAALKGAGTASEIGNLSKAGDAAMTASTMTDPLSVASGTLQKGIKTAIPKNYARDAYQSAAKFSTTLPTKERNRLTKIALDAGIMPNQKGMEKLRGLIDDLDGRISGLIDEHVASGDKIPAAKLFKHFGDAYKQAGLSDMPGKARNAVNKVWKDRWNELMIKKYYTPEEAQKIKQNIYQDIHSAYANNKYDQVTTTAKKGIARAAKESLEEIIPEIKQLNKQDGDYIALMEAVERKANRISNNEGIFGSLGVPVNVGAGAAMGGEAGAMLGLINGIYNKPQMKARLAIIVNKLQKRGVKINKTGLGVRLGLINIGRLSDSVGSDDEWTTNYKKVDKVKDDDLIQ